MGKNIKIMLMVLLFLLILFSVIADHPKISNLVGILSLSFYVRISSIFGLLIAVFWVWGYKYRIITSQKYRLADQVLAEAQATAKRKERALMLVDEKLKADYARKVQALHEEMQQLKSKHHEQMMALRIQNVRLKDIVNKLMQTLKIKKQRSVKVSK